MNCFERLIYLTFLVASSVSGYASGEPLGVLYPEVREPYNKVFETIIGGIESEIGEKIDKYSLDKSFNSEQLGSEIKANENRVILALGTRSLKALRELDLTIPVVMGAILPGSVELDEAKSTGISLLPEPSILFKKLISFAPNIKIVSVVYNPERNQSLIDQALISAQRIGLKLDARPARDLRSSARIYKELAETIDGRTNAIWLLQDRTTIDSDSILPYLLEEAWDRQFIVFSSKLEHAKRGALFSMYPDNFKMGRELGKLVKQVEINSVANGFAGLRSLKTAVNTRTAKHLGIDLMSREGKSFDLVFPMQ